MVGTRFNSVVITLLAVAWTTSAIARVQCQGDFQVTNYGLIATPYCEEENIAVVAQSYGWQVTASQVHNNPLKKVYICQVLGRDIRLKGPVRAIVPTITGADRVKPTPGTHLKRGLNHRSVWHAHSLRHTSTFQSDNNISCITRAGLLSE